MGIGPHQLFGTLAAARLPAFVGGDVTSALGSVLLTIGDKKVTLPKMADMATASLLGRNTAGAGAPEVLSAATVAALLPLATSAAKGLLAPADLWTTKKLALDFTAPNSTTFTDISDGTTVLNFTPPASSDWELEGRILIWTTSATNLPRGGISVAAGAQAGYGSANLWQAGATANASVSAFAGWNNPGAAVTGQMAAGGVLAASTPYLCEVIAAGRSGTTPTAISIQLACETAAANTCLAKRGSFIKYRVF